MDLIFMSPLGPLKLVFSARGLAGVEFLAEQENTAPGLEGKEEVQSPPGVEKVVAALQAYFAGKPMKAEDLPLDLRGTPFQLRVWGELMKIPAGTVISYGELARRLGKPKAARAVGQALGANPIPILIPCHRVIAGDGGLGGYRAGLARKRRLLGHEGVVV